MLSKGQGPWFDMAEGNYPYASTYITYAVGPGDIPLPPWPMRVACETGALNMDYGMTFAGNKSEVKYTVSLGELKVGIDWNESSAIGGDAAFAAAMGDTRSKGAAGLRSIVRGIAKAVGVWYNITGDLPCYKVFGEENGGGTADVALAERAEPNPTAHRAAPPPDPETAAAGVCGLSYADHSKTESWGGVTCNENLHLINTELRGVGRDFFWPPNVERDWSLKGLVGGGRRGGCRDGPRDPSGYPATADPYSSWLNDYYGGLKLAGTSNIVFSNGEGLHTILLC